MAVSIGKTVVSRGIITGLLLFPIERSMAETQPPTPGFVLRSVSVELPSGDRAFPDGPNVDIVSANCAACHSVGMILNQPRLTQATWEAEVKKMIHVYKAPVEESDTQAIVAYLVAIKGR